MIHRIGILCVFFLAVFSGFQTSGQNIPLTSQSLEPLNVKVEEAQYKGKKGVHVIGTNEKGDQMAIIKGLDFRNGTIEVELSGKPYPSADTTHRGFIGLAFRVQKNDSLRYECFYLRPTNGRSSDQLRRNHSTQYVSTPGFPWFKLRKENPGLYESYVDLDAGEWTKVKVEVRGRNAKLYVNGAEQPCLIVSDLKRGISTGGIALWTNNGTDSYFRELKVKKE